MKKIILLLLLFTFQLSLFSQEYGVKKYGKCNVTYTIVGDCLIVKRNTVSKTYTKSSSYGKVTTYKRMGVSVTVTKNYDKSITIGGVKYVQR